MDIEFTDEEKQVILEMCRSKFGDHIQNMTEEEAVVFFIQYYMEIIANV